MPKKRCKSKKEEIYLEGTCELNWLGENNLMLNWVRAREEAKRQESSEKRRSAWCSTN